MSEKSIDEFKLVGSKLNKDNISALSEDFLNEYNVYRYYPSEHLK